MTTPLPTSPSSPPPRFLLLLLVALAVRVGTVVLGVWLATLPPQVLAPDDRITVETRERITSSSARVIEPWYRWDAGWMVNIATHGYAGPPNPDGQSGVAFSPAMPATLAAGELLGVNPFWFGLVIVNVISAAGAALFAQVAARLLNDTAAGWRTLILLLTFPTAFFYSAPYNESFGLFFTAIALAAWMANRPGTTGLGALGGSLARLTGVALGVAAICDWLIKCNRRELWRALSMTVGSFAGLALFCCFLWWAVGDPFAMLKSHKMWGRRELSLWNLQYAIESIYDPNLQRPDNATHFGWEAVALFGFMALGIRAWWKRGAFWGIIVLVPVGQMLLSGTMLSAHRIVLAGLPAFIELADLLRRRAWLFVAAIGFAFAQLLLLNRYVHWQFAG